MNKTEFTKYLRKTAEGLRPLTQVASSNAATWDGKEYVKQGEKKPDPFALAWWSTLLAISELIDAQNDSLSLQQIAYLDRLLFGGMGSLNDLYFDPQSAGPSAQAVNKQLDENRKILFAIRNDIATGSVHEK